MDSNYREYDYEDSFARIDDILATPSGNFEEVDNLPDRDKLTFTNGFYANCTAMFIDIRDSSSLPSIYQRPALAKLYRAFISEMVAIFNGTMKAREINIVGDCVWGVYKTPYKSDLDHIFSLSAQAHSLTKVLNYKFGKAGYTTPLRFGIGLSWGRALMIKAGYSGSGINDVVYMGDVVNAASKLAALGSTTGQMDPIVVDPTFYQNLNEDNRGFFKSGYNTRGTFYHADVVDTAMNEWYKSNCT